jgi:integrase
MRFTRLLESKGIQHMSFHDLRHMSASIMLALGIPDKYAMERGGWSTPSVMKSVYQHTFSAERQAVDDKIDNYFNALLKELDTEQ